MHWFWVHVCVSVGVITTKHEQHVVISDSQTEWCATKHTPNIAHSFEKLYMPRHHFVLLFSMSETTYASVKKKQIRFYSEPKYREKSTLITRRKNYLRYQFLQIPSWKHVCSNQQRRYGCCHKQNQWCVHTKLVWQDLFQIFECTKWYALVMPQNRTSIFFQQSIFHRCCGLNEFNQLQINSKLQVGFNFFSFEL